MIIRRVKRDSLTSKWRPNGTQELSRTRVAGLLISALNLYEVRCIPVLMSRSFRCAHYPCGVHYAILALDRYPLITALRASVRRFCECGSEVPVPGRSGLN